MPDAPPLTEQVALVTGASQGIGTEIAAGLLTQGVKVYVTGHQLAPALAAADELSARTGGVAIGKAFELTDLATADRLVADVVGEAGRLDILVNNAGIDVDMGVEALDTDLTVAELTFSANVLGAWRLIQLAVPVMRRQAYGRIVNVSSSLASFAVMGDREKNWPGDDAYKISKAALNALTVLVAGPLTGTGILVNASNPGFCRTGLGAPDAPLSAAEGADVSIFLATLPDDGPHGQWFTGRETMSW